MWGSFLIFSTIVLIWLWHLLAPQDTHFLSHERFGEIQLMIFSAMAMHIIPSVNKYLKD